jgi:hypothetical protein
MNVEIGAEAALFPEKEYVNGIAFQSKINNHQLPYFREYTYVDILLVNKLVNFGRAKRPCAARTLFKSFS